MNIPGLTHEEAVAFRDACRAPGAEVHTRALVLDLDHKPVGTLPVEGGQVRWNASADVVTEATVASSDARDALDLDLRNLVRAEMGIETDLGRLWCPTITGWVVAPTDHGDSAEFTLHDKTAIGLVANRRQKFGENRYVGDVIREANEAIGETRFDIPRSLREGGPKLGRVVHMGGPNPDKAITRMCKRLARRADLQFYADQLGRIVVRRPPKHPSASWVEEDPDSDSPRESDGGILGPLSFQRDLTKVRNRVVAKGRKGLRLSKDEQETNILEKFVIYNGVIEAPPDHAYSPRNLARNGVRLELTHYFTDDSIDSRAELRDAAIGVLRRLLIDRADVTFASSAVPWANPFDLSHARRLDGRYADFRMPTGSMDLDWSGMTVGYQQTWVRPGHLRVRRLSATRHTRREHRHRGHG